MSVYSHNIYQNIRTRTIVLHEGCLLVIPAGKSREGSIVWRLPGGGLEPRESLADCARREILEETGITVTVGRIAFLREWVVPTHVQLPDPNPDGREYGFGIEVFHYAIPVEPVPALRPEKPSKLPPKWVPIVDVPAIPIWPKEIKALCRRLIRGTPPEGAISFIGSWEGPLEDYEADPFE
jgi:phosphatase NudJ